MDAAYRRPLEGAVASEDMVSISSDEKAFTQIRFKKRTQYKNPEPGTSKWKIDITEVGGDSSRWKWLSRDLFTRVGGRGGA